MDQAEVVKCLVNSLTQKETFTSLLTLLNPYIDGNLLFSNIVCNDFIERLSVKGCSPTGKVPNNEFVFKILKLYHIPRDLTVRNLKGMQEASLYYGVHMETYFGKIRKHRTFKPSLMLVCAILSDVFINTRSTLNWYGADPFQILKSDHIFDYKLKKKYEEMKKIMVKKDIVPTFLVSDFDPSEFFVSSEESSFTFGKHNKIFNIEKCACTESISMCEQASSSKNAATSNSTFNLEQPSSKRRKISQVEELAHTQSISSYKQPYSCKSASNNNIRHFKKQERISGSYKHSNYSHMPFAQKNVRAFKSKVSVATQTLKMYNKITMSKSTFKNNCDRISKLQHTLSKIKHENAQSKKYADDLEKALILSEARHSSEIDTLNKKIEEFETLIAAQKLEIQELKAIYQSDYEVEKFNIELVEQIDDTAVKQSIEAIEKDISLDFPEIHMRESFRKINPTIMKTLSALRLSVGLSLRNCIITLVIVGNYCFSQKWRLPKIKNITRASGPERCLLPDARVMAQGAEKLFEQDKNIILNTAPGISCLKNFINDILEPAAFSSIFSELKNSEYSTLGADHYAEHRHKFQTQNVITYTIDEEGNKRARYRCLGLSNIYDTSGEQTFHQVQRLVQLAAILTAKSEDASDIEASLSEILSKVKFSVKYESGNGKIWRLAKRYYRQQ